MLKRASKCFDPAGFISLFTITVKCLLKELLKKGFVWNEIFDDNMKDGKSGVQKLNN